MRRQPPIPDEARAAAALAMAAGLVNAEARRLRIVERCLDPQGVAGLAAWQWLRAGSRSTAELRAIVRRRLIDDLRTATGWRPHYRHRQQPPTVSIEDLDPGLEHPLDLPAPREGPAPEVLDRCAELFSLPLNAQQQHVLDLLVVGWTRRRIYKRLGISESRLCQVVADIRRTYERERDGTMRPLRHGDPPGARQADHRLGRRPEDQALPDVRAGGRTRPDTGARAAGRAVAGILNCGRGR